MTFDHYEPTQHHSNALVHEKTPLVRDNTGKQRTDADMQDVTNGKEDKRDTGEGALRFGMVKEWFPQIPMTLPYWESKVEKVKYSMPK